MRISTVSGRKEMKFTTPMHVLTSGNRTISILGDDASAVRSRIAHVLDIDDDQVLGSSTARASSSRHADVVVIADFADLCDFDAASLVAPDGWLVLAGDGPGRKVPPRLEINRGRVLCCGRGAGCDIVASDIAFADGCLRFRVGQQWFQAPAWSRSSLKEVLAAVAVASIFCVPLAGAAERLAQSPPAGGPRVAQADDVTIVHDTSAVTAVLLGRALDLLREFPAAGRRIVCCGELDGDQSQGGESPGSGQANQLESVCRDFGGETVTRCGADAVIALGATAQHVVEAAREAGLRAACAVACGATHEASSRLAAMLGGGDVLLVVGGQAEVMSQIGLRASDFRQASDFGLQATAV